MPLDSAITWFRREQAKLFRDTATVRRPQTAQAGTINPTGGQWTPGDAVVVYSGPCLVRTPRWEAAEVEAGGTNVLLPHPVIKFPQNTDVRRDDIVTVTASKYDVGLVGRSFKIRDEHVDGWQICRWMIAEEVIE